MRLKSKLYVQALIRRAEAQGASAYVVRSGSEEAGAVFVKVNRLDGSCEIYSPAQRLDEAGQGERFWTRPLGAGASEAAAAAYFERQLRFDPDIWIVEVEDREGRNFLVETVA